VDTQPDHHGSSTKTDELALVDAPALEFVGGGDDQVAVFVRNATEAINLLAAALPPGSKVLSSPYEHHANMLPWRARHEVELLPFVACPEELLEATERALVAARGSIDLVAITGASNVTGETWPLRRLADVAAALAGDDPESARPVPIDDPRSWPQLPIRLGGVAG
jgi:selenocysteine lyase/cysteine desulfurase